MSDLWTQENQRADVVIMVVGLCLLAIMLGYAVRLVVCHRRKSRYKGRHRA